MCLSDRKRTKKDYACLRERLSKRERIEKEKKECIGYIVSSKNTWYYNNV